MACLLLVGCGAAGPAGGGNPAGTNVTPSAPACSALPPASGPDVSGTLGAVQNGGTYCLRVGERVSVFLSVAPDHAGTSHWAPITVANPGLLRPVPSGALTLVLGVTAGIFEAAAPGQSRLSSERSGCAADSPGCPGLGGWEATVVVGARR